MLLVWAKCVYVFVLCRTVKQSRAFMAKSACCFVWVCLNGPHHAPVFVIFIHAQRIANQNEWTDFYYESPTTVGTLKANTPHSFHTHTVSAFHGDVCIWSARYAVCLLFFVRCVLRGMISSSNVFCFQLSEIRSINYNVLRSVYVVRIQRSSNIAMKTNWIFCK